MPRLICIVAALAMAMLLASCGGSSSSSSPSASPSPDSVSWLFSTTSDGGTLKATGDGKYLLTLTGVDKHTIAFADRPERDVDVVATGDFVASWVKNFAGDPPNAVLIEHDPQGPADSLVLVLSHPVYDAKAATLTYAAKVTADEAPDRVAALVGEAHAEAPARFRAASLFIDTADLTSDPPPQPEGTVIVVTDPPYTGFPDNVSGHIAAAPIPNPATYSGGDTIVAPYSNGHYYLATIFMREDNKLGVTYADDGTHGMVWEEDCRPTQNLTFVVGDEVYAVWTTGRLYSGTITAVDGSTNPVMYTVKWDDGSPSSQVPKCKIMPEDPSLVMYPGGNATPL